MSAEDLKDWDKRFWIDAKTLCLDCLPVGIANEVRRQLASEKGPVGSTGGSDPCVKCGRSRLEVLTKSRVPIPVGSGRTDMTEVDYGRQLARPAPLGEGPVGPSGIPGGGLSPGQWREWWARYCS